VDRDRSLEIRVGLFMVLGLIVTIFGVVLLGSESKLFEPRYVLNASFEDVSGLRPGAQIQLSGLNVGIVSAVEFPRDLNQKVVFVRMNIVQRYQKRIRGDSIATISSQGLLGDKYVSVTVGSPARQPLTEGSWLETEEPITIAGYLSDFDEIIENVKSITKTIDVILKGEDGQNAGKSVAAIFASIRNVVTELEQGRGLIHELVYDKKVAQRFKSVVANLDETTAQIKVVINEIKNGDGTLHALVYEDQISELLTSLTATAQKVEALVVEIKDGKGLIHDLVYTERGQSMLANLTDASADIRDVVAAVKRGEGTVGALLVDPTLYEDVKILLGRAQRNKILKDYVRETMRRNEREERLDDGRPISDGRGGDRAE
jgi:phospholipid/cholesterol/gamma-HCH transport system substrate-binding protein